MIKGFIIPSVVKENDAVIGFSTIIIVGQKTVVKDGLLNATYDTALIAAINAGLEAIRVNARVTVFCLPLDYIRIKYKNTDDCIDQNVVAEYHNLAMQHASIVYKKLPKNFELPKKREVPEEISRKFEEYVNDYYDVPPEEDEDGAFCFDYIEEDATMKNSMPAVTNESVVKKEDNIVKVNVSYIINSVKSTKEVTLEEAIAFLTRADKRNVPAYYTVNNQSFLNKTAQAMKKPAAPAPVKVSSEAAIPTVELWVDGACSNNGAENAKAGWGAVLVFGDKQKEMSGLVEGDQTNNRAEITAVIAGLSALKKHCNVLVHTDSQVVTRAPQIIERGYKTAAGRPAANQDLLEKLAEVMKNHDVTIIKVEGHAGIDLNEKCDALARAAVVEANGKVLKNHACVVDEEEQKDIKVINAIKANVANMSIQKIAEELEALDCWTDTEPARLIDETIKLAFKAHPETKCRMEYEMQKMDEQCCEAYGCHHCEKWVEIVVYDENDEVIAQIPINDL